MSTRTEIEFRKSQVAVLLTQMIKDGDMKAEMATEFIQSLTDFIGKGTNEGKAD